MSTYYESKSSGYVGDVDVIDLDRELDPYSLPERSLSEFEFGRVEEVQRRNVRQEIVPYWRRVKVPVVTRMVVPHTFQKRVKVAKKVQVPAYESVTEKYTTMREETLMRTRPHWVQVEEQETYTVMEPKIMTHMVRKPVTEIEEEPYYQVITVPGTRIEDVEGFRIDEKPAVRTIDVEMWEVFEMLPHKAHTIQGDRINLGSMNYVVKRTPGETIYKVGEEYKLDKTIDVKNLEVDFVEGRDHAFESGNLLIGSGSTNVNPQSYMLSSTSYNGGYRSGSTGGFYAQKWTDADRKQFESGSTTTTTRYTTSSSSSSGFQETEQEAEWVSGPSTTTTTTTTTTTQASQLTEEF